ncbi:MAG: glutamate synthase-related protein, partial [Pseudomonadota bacterium]
CSGAMQTGSDVVKASLLGGDSFEFGTTALMMLKCVMAKNCNIKCPAGLTTNPEVFDGDPRALAQYLLNIAHEVREILALLGFKSLDEARGRADLLHLLDHPSSVGQLNLRDMLINVPEVIVDTPTYLERDYTVDDGFIDLVRTALVDKKRPAVSVGGDLNLNNRHKSVGGQLAIDIERLLNHQLEDVSSIPAVRQDDRGRRFLDARSVEVRTHGSAGQSFGAFCNDGMVLEHTGTCNDGVGKGASGGEIVVKSPRGGGTAYGENVLIGNFALFGATGGRTFIAGQAGDRFAVRNSGATAVVEGVGDFCAEYMTNGAILNLGGFAKGFGNGMSGGFAYQYDPDDALADAISHDSVLVQSLVGDDPRSSIHEDAVRLLLQWHVAATKSPLAIKILETWDTVKGQFKWIMPRALLQYQDAQEILATSPRKELVEELSSALAMHQILKLKRSWKEGTPIHHGAVPAHGDTDSEEMFDLLNSWTVLEVAQSVVRKRTNLPDGDAGMVKATRNLILTEDFSLVSQLSRHARTALSGYSDEDLSALVANKRLTDFKRALSIRNILSTDSPGTYGWILYQSRQNADILGRIPSFEELFAQNALPDMAARMVAE